MIRYSIAAALVLAAPVAAAELPAIKPFTASYSADMEIRDGRDVQSVKQYADKKALRMEFAAEGATFVSVIDFGTQKGFSYQPGAKGQDRMVMVMDMKAIQAQLPFQIDTAVETDSETRKVGTARVAGETCTEYEPSDSPGDRICITDDGILLRVTEAGKAEPVLLVTKLDRGPQDAKLFQPPEGYQVMDLGAMMGALGGIMSQMPQGFPGMPPRN